MVPKDVNIDLENNSPIPDKYEDLALNHRKIFIDDEITKDLIFSAVYYIYKLIDKDDKLGYIEPIDIYINTNGGYCSEGFILVDLIEQLKKQGYRINTIVTGTAYSFGFILALMGTHRYCYRHCDYMCHTVQIFSPPSSLPNFKRVVERSEKMQKTIEDYVFANTNITEEYWNENIAEGNDWYLDAEEAIKLGIAHEIV